MEPHNIIVCMNILKYHFKKIEQSLFVKNSHWHRYSKYRFPCIRGRRAAPPNSDSKRTTLAGLFVFEKLYAGILLLLLLVVELSMVVLLVSIVDSKVEKVCRYLLQLITRSNNNSLNAFFEDCSIIIFEVKYRNAIEYII